MTPASEWERCNPQALRAAERLLLEARRSKAGVDPLAGGDPNEALAAGSVGIGLSGGGIRSATQSLGFFQALADSKLLPQVDYLSTVSGGGYFGSYLGRLFTRGKDPQAVQQELVNEGQSVRWLRDHGNYLAPHGSGDAIVAIAVLLRNWLATLAVTGTLLLLFFVAVRTAIALVQEFGVAVPQSILLGVSARLSPIVVAGAAGLALWAVPWGIAYWFIDSPREERWQPKARPLGRVLDAIAKLRPIAFVVLVLPAIAWALSRILPRGNGTEPEARSKSEPKQRNVASHRLSLALIVSGLTLVLGLADSLGATLWLHISNANWGWLASALTAVTAVAAGARKIISTIGPAAESGWKARTSVVMLPALAVVVGGLLHAVLSMLSFAIAEWGLPPLPSGETGLLPLAVAFAVLLTLCATFRSKWSFVNRSSFHPFYGARLTRAYLGASNPERHADGPTVRECHDDDDVEHAAYAPHEQGGPLHLINVTVNETLIGRSGLQHVRSGGVGMAVGPAGLSVAARHHGLWDGGLEDDARRLVPIGVGGGFHVFEPEKGQGCIACEALTLGQWTAISGAAASTGMGARTSLPRSLLAGIFNVRLGYWWDSGVGRDPIQAVQDALLRFEYLARFPGVARRQWNLSDGGHFENLAGYELLRRRLPVIVICDFEQDESYTFSGLGNLVRKARIDFGAEVRFVTAAELDALVAMPVRRWFGGVEELRRGTWAEEPVKDPVTGEPRRRVEADVARPSRALFALAHVKYDDNMGGSATAPGESWLVYVKPALLGDEPADVRQYHAAHQTFPHESTGDQFFDEAQWESYRRLGEHLGVKLFTPGEGSSGPSGPAAWIRRGFVVAGPYKPPPEPAATSDASGAKKTRVKKTGRKPASRKAPRKPPAT